MDVKNSNEIITEFISRCNFVQIYSDYSFGLFGVGDEFLGIGADKSLDILYSSAIAANRVIGFFDNLPPFTPQYATKGGCILITKTLPTVVRTPVLFCKSLDTFPNILSTALRVSSEIALPVIVAVSDNIFNNFVKSSNNSYDHNRIAGYIYKQSFSNKLTVEQFVEKMVSADQLLSELLPNNHNNKNISFIEPQKQFISYILPLYSDGDIDLIEVEVDEKEYDSIYKVLSARYHVKISEPTAKKSLTSLDIKEYLCSGCPFLVYFTMQYDKSTLYFTDINCEGMLKKYNIHYVPFEYFVGINSSQLNVRTVFIGKASSFNSLYFSMLSSGSVILLNDADYKSINGFKKIKNIYKSFSDYQFVLMPYSCNNIKTYKSVSLKYSKCDKCIGVDYPVCLTETSCVALSYRYEKILVNKELCTGCKACVTICPKAAIR